MSTPIRYARERARERESETERARETYSIKCFSHATFGDLGILSQELQQELQELDREVDGTLVRHARGSDSRVALSVEADGHDRGRRSLVEASGADADGREWRCGAL